MNFHFSLFKVYEQFLYFHNDYTIKIYNTVTKEFVATTQKVLADIETGYQIPNSPSIITHQGNYNVFAPQALFSSVGLFEGSDMVNGVLVSD